jgi:hypothetical protein
MNAGTDRAITIKSRIARRSERIAKWEKEALDVETSWTGGADYRRFCEAMAGDARVQKAELEAELKHLQG